MADLTVTGNLVEAGVWFTISFALFLGAIRGERRFRRPFVVLSVAFLVFGVSDLIEARTGAWWRPLWLLLMKAGCLIVLVLGFRAYYRVKNTKDCQP